MARKRMTIRSNFKAVKKASKDAIDKAVDEALVTAEEETQTRLARTGYDDDPFVVRVKNFGDGEGGMFFVPSDKWYYRFREYGTVHLPAKPFMRPAHRKARKEFVEKMGDKLEPAIRRRAGVR